MSRMVVKGLFKGGKSSLDSTQGCLPFVFFVCVWGFTTCMEGPYGFFGMVVHVFQWLCVVVIFNIWYGYFYMCLMVVLWMLQKLNPVCNGCFLLKYWRIPPTKKSGAGSSEEFHRYWSFNSLSFLNNRRLIVSPIAGRFHLQKRRQIFDLRMSSRGRDDASKAG